MTCDATHSACPVDQNGPGSAASSTFENIVKPAGPKSKCIECGDYECCCIPCTVM
ncbi:hypothetical protein Micbo1qcDRAFT_166626 [Microdochium bolleyi]|uniref:Uncharacterized protein n=1 Tax=Microdochium bolleyi TaxID=196109 RepID=A0A136IUS7_9PEZI|nr:hypothetical protein Micbo1qcDRAFT_166626 [Microdochium bolleyi]